MINEQEHSWHPNKFVFLRRAVGCGSLKSTIKKKKNPPSCSAAIIFLCKCFKLTRSFTFMENLFSFLYIHINMKHQLFIHYRQLVHDQFENKCEKSQSGLTTITKKEYNT